MPSRSKKQRQRRNLIALLRKAQRERCGFCGRRVPPAGVYCSRANRPTIDHVIPRSKGGTRRIGNILLMHEHCNRQKADRMPTGCELLMLAATNARVARVTV